MRRLYLLSSYAIVCIVAVTGGGCGSSYRPLYPPYTLPSPSQESPSPSSVHAPPTATSSPLRSPSIREHSLDDTPPSLSSPSSTGRPSTAPSSPKTPPHTGAQQIASVSLVENARQMREKGKVDDAIRTLERAIEIDAYNGEAFYELALCWKKKGSMKKSLSFADRAERLFAGRRDKLRNVYLLKAQLLEAMGQRDEAARYRGKAR